MSATIPIGHVLGGIGDDVGHDPHGGLGRVDVGVADHELLQDVVLDGAGELVLADPLLLGGHDVAGQDRQHRPVHGHGDAHLVERNAVEEDLHVLHRIDRHPGLAHVARDPGVVGVVASVGRQIEGHGEALLAAPQALLGGPRR
jgi:hypothetical protein